MPRTPTQVRLAHQKVIGGQPMAIKTALDPDDLDELADEASIHARVQQTPHPHIVPLRYTIADEQNPDFVTGLVTEYCPEGSLYDWLRSHTCCDSLAPEFSPSRRQVPWITRLDIAEQILSGLQHIHSSGVAHLDIKPANILMRNSPHSNLNALIADFGLSAIIDGDFLDGHRGTLLYMPPEMLRQSHTVPDPSQDVWSFGVLLLDMVCDAPAGRRMFAKQVREALVAGTMYTDLSHIHCEPDYLALARRCLESSPDHRPSVSELLQAVQQMRCLCSSGIARGTLQ
jgi:serine/threonine protein kinase